MNNPRNGYPDLPDVVLGREMKIPKKSPEILLVHKTILVLERKTKIAHLIE
jgi:hypothetical protein